MRFPSRLNLVAATLLTLGVTANAQVILTPEDSVLVDRYFVEEPALPPPVVIEDNITLRPGSAVPGAVPLRPFGGTSKLAQYAFFVSVDNKVVVVDPATRTVVRILDVKR